LISAVSLALGNGAHRGPEMRRTGRLISFPNNFLQLVQATARLSLCP